MQNEWVLCFGLIRKFEKLVYGAHVISGYHNLKSLEDFGTLVQDNEIPLLCDRACGREISLYVAGAILK